MLSVHLLSSVFERVDSFLRTFEWVFWHWSTQKLRQSSIIYLVITWQMREHVRWERRCRNLPYGHPTLSLAFSLEAVKQQSAAVMEVHHKHNRTLRVKYCLFRNWPRYFATAISTACSLIGSRRNGQAELYVVPKQLLSLMYVQSKLPSLWKFLQRAKIVSWCARSALYLSSLSPSRGNSIFVVAVDQRLQYGDSAELRSYIKQVQYIQNQHLSDRFKT
jgi:hypothetical protein